MKSARVLVLYNEPVLPESHPDYISEVEVLDNVLAVKEVLAAGGYDVAELAITSEPEKLIEGIRALAPDAIVNLFEGFADNNASELYVAGMLEWLGIPYTGCPFHTLVMARSKHVAKRMFLAEGLPTAPFVVLEPGDGPMASCPLPFPVIVKPATQDASVGIDQESVVTTLEALNARAAFLMSQFGGPVMVEEFIRGRELTVALVEMPDLRFLPGTEVVFPADAPEGYWPILSYAAKWTAESTEYQSTDYHFHADLSPELAAEIESHARRAFRLLGARDYARVDFRIRDGKPYVLELNPNPDFAPDRALANNLWAGGLTHEEFTLQIVRNALARAGGPSRERWSGLREAS